MSANCGLSPLPISCISPSKSIYEQLEDIVNLASKPLPERPDGIVTVAKFTSSESPDCRASEASYERLARDNPATVFLRCFKEMDNAESLFLRARVEVLPCFDVFYQGMRVWIDVIDSMMYQCRLVEWSWTLNIAYKLHVVHWLLGTRTKSSTYRRTTILRTRNNPQSIPIPQFRARSL